MPRTPIVRCRRESRSTRTRCGGRAVAVRVFFCIHGSRLASRGQGQLEKEAASRSGSLSFRLPPKKLRGKGMVLTIGASRSYEPELAGLRAMTALLVLREKVFRPLLGASPRPQPGSKRTTPHRWIGTSRRKADRSRLRASQFGHGRFSRATIILLTTFSST